MSSGYDLAEAFVIVPVIGFVHRIDSPGPCESIEVAVHLDRRDTAVVRFSHDSLHWLFYDPHVKRFRRSFCVGSKMRRAVLRSTRAIFIKLTQRPKIHTTLVRLVHDL